MTYGGVLTSTYSPPPAPAVTSISPATGPAAGGTSVAITGTDFTGASAVSFGATPAASFTVNSATSITATSPAGTGTVNVRVTTGSGTSATGAGNSFTYISATVAPAITTNPSNVSVSAGNTASFSAAASGTPTPTVQWQVSTDNGATFSNVAGATSTTLSFTAVAADNAKRFRAVFTNSGGLAVSTAAVLTVTSAPAITANPSSATVTAGNTATFTAAASGSPTPTVQWQVSSDLGASYTNIAGATSTTLSFTTSLADSANRYRAVFTNSAGTAVSTGAVLTIQTLPVITTQPVGGTAAPGQSIPLSAAATGTPTPSAQWYYSDDNGATFAALSNSLSFSLAAPTPRTALVKVTFTNSAGSVTSNTVSLVWVKQNQTISFTSAAPAAAVVGGTSYSPTATATSGLAVSLAIDAASSSVCSISGGAVSFQSVGTCTINADQAGNTTYNAAPQVQQSFTVGQGANVITFPALADTLLTGAAPVPAATASSGLAVTYATTTTGVCTVTSGGSITLVSAGNCSITASQAGNSNYVAATDVTRSFAVTKGANVITFPVLPDTAFTAAPPAPAATASSGLTVSYATTTTGVCTVTSGGVISFVAAGNCTITASQAGNANYDAASDVSRTFAVTQGANTITFPALSDTAFTSTPPSPAATASSGLAVSYATTTTGVCTVTSGGVISFVATGNCTITASQAGNGNFVAASDVSRTFAVTPGVNTITFPALPDTAFTSTPPSPAASASSGLAVSYSTTTTGVCTVTSGGAISFVATGNCTITASQAGNGNYAAASNVSRTFAVTPGVNTITFPALPDTAFTSTPPSPAASASSGLAVSYATTTAGVCTVTSGGAISFVAAGNCSITASQAGNANYAAASDVTRTFAVTPGVNTITFPALSDTAFTSTPPSPSASASASSGLAISYSTTTTSVCTVTSGGTISFVAVGSCAITASQAGNANYQAASDVTRTFNVTPGVNTITFAALPNRALGSGNFALGASASSGLAVSYASTTGTICSVSGSTVSLLAVGTCSITASQAGNGNFQAASPVSQSFQVTKAVATVALSSSASTVYFGQPVTLTANVFGIAPTGSVTFNDGATALGTVSLSGNVATFTTSTLVAGSHQLTANYLGDASNLPANSATVTLTVNARPDPSKDPEVRGVLDAQVRTAERFARTQMDNVAQRLDQLHNDGDGHDTMEIRLSQPQARLRSDLPYGMSGQQSRYGYGNRAGQPMTSREAMLANLAPNAPWMPGAPLGVAPAVSGGEGSADGTAAPRNAAAGGADTRPLHVWANGDLSFGKELPNGSVETRFTTSGITVGMDGRATDNLKLGVAIGFAWDHSRIGTHGSESDAANASLAFYGSFKAAEKTYIDLIVGTGYGTINSTRLSTAGQVFLDGKRRNSQIFAALIGTFEARAGRLEIAPYLRADGIWVHLAPYTETGSPIWALAYQATNDNTLNGAFGTKLRYPLDEAGHWLVTAKGEYRTRLSGGYTQLLDYADIIGANGSPYVITGYGSSSSTFTGGLGLEARLEAMSLRLYYDLTTQAGGNVGHGISGGVSVKF